MVTMENKTAINTSNDTASTIKINLLDYVDKKSKDNIDKTIIRCCCDC